MFRSILLASALAVSAPAFAQAQMAMPMPAGTAMTATDVGVSPLTGISATDYVKMAADSDMFEITTGRLAGTKGQSSAVKSFGREMVTDHMGTTKALMAALRNADRKIARPSMRMSSDNAAMVTLLRKAPRANFDNLYLQQQMTAHQKAWALHKGYATEGTDPALRQVAAAAVPIVERHITHLKSLMPASMTAQ